MCVYLYTYTHKMKNVTLSMPKPLIDKAREYAKKHGTTLNQMIRDLITKQINEKHESRAELIDEIRDELQLKTKNYKFNREEIYER